MADFQWLPINTTVEIILNTARDFKGPRRNTARDHSRPHGSTSDHMGPQGDCDGYRHLGDVN